MQGELSLHCFFLAGYIKDEVIFMSKGKSINSGFSNAREPKNSFDYVNMYGTYNIQPTADRDDEYPAIAQGLSRAANLERERARAEWKAEQAEKPQSGDALEADPAKGIDGALPDLPSNRKG